MFGRRKSTAVEEAEPTVSEPGPDGKKNRPTRSRKDAEAARKRPLVVNDRKEARKRERERAMKARAAEQKGLLTNDEKLMPERDRGPVKRFVRNYVDSRRNVGEYSMILVFIPVALTFAPSLEVQRWSIYLLWALIGATFIDTYIMARMLHGRLRMTFSPEQLAGQRPVRYGIMRALQMRRLRLPRTVLKHGDKFTP